MDERIDDCSSEACKTDPSCFEKCVGTLVSEIIATDMLDDNDCSSEVCRNDPSCVDKCVGDVVPDLRSFRF